jgi:predicted DNA-binding protein with PD1-like motif
VLLATVYSNHEEHEETRRMALGCIHQLFERRSIHMESNSLLRAVGWQSIGDVIQLAVKPGSDLLAAIEEGVLRENVRAGVFVSGVGALSRAVFRSLRRFPETYPVRDEDRLYFEVEKPMELLSVGGWLAPDPDGKVEMHAHFSASMVEDDVIVTRGGHLTTGTICGIKVVVAILVLADRSVRAEYESVTQSYDIFFKDHSR